MTIAGGRTNCAAERALLFGSYRDMLSELEQSYENSLVGIKAQLYDILTATDMSPEEIKTYSASYKQALVDVEEKAIRIRSAIYVSLYCAWENGLKDICSKFSIKVSADKTYRYYNAIYKDTKTWEKGCMLYAMAKLRNYIVHGAMKDNELNDIKRLATQMPEWDIAIVLRSAYFKSYTALYKVLDFFESGLCEAELYASTNLNKPQL